MEPGEALSFYLQCLSAAKGLAPLPKQTHFPGWTDIPYYTAAQMRAYAAAEVARHVAAERDAMLAQLDERTNQIERLRSAVAEYWNAWDSQADPTAVGSTCRALRAESALREMVRETNAETQPAAAGELGPAWESFSRYLGAKPEHLDAARFPELCKTWATWQVAFGAGQSTERELCAATARRWGETHADGVTVNARNAASKIARAIEGPNTEFRPHPPAGVGPATVG
jgi:hypothetical protein